MCSYGSQGQESFASGHGVAVSWARSPMGKQDWFQVPQGVRVL